jgi:hypothetical protein
VLEALEDFVETSVNIASLGREALYRESRKAPTTAVGFT